MDDKLASPLLKQNVKKMNSIDGVVNDDKMKTPILFSLKTDCCGCYACYSICTVGAIEMIEDDEGFVYPVIDPDKCIRCMACQRICPIKNK